MALGWLWGGFGVALGWLWGGFGVALGWLWGGFGVALGWLWGGFGVALGWLCGGFGVALGWLWGGFGVPEASFRTPRNLPKDQGSSNAEGASLEFQLSRRKDPPNLPGPRALEFSTWAKHTVSFLGSSAYS